MNRVVIVIGLRSQGLTVSRLLGDAGLKVYCLCHIDDVKHKEYLYCRYIWNRVVIFNTIEELLSGIDAVKKENRECELEIVITSASWLAKLRENVPRLWHEFNVKSGPIEAINTLADKHEMYNLCRSLDIPTVRDVIYPQYTSGCINFPIVIKHNVESIWIAEKCVKVDNEEDMFKVINKIPEKIRRYLILQEFIDKDFIEVDFRGYVHNGRIIGWSLVESIRSKPIGISSYLEEITEPQILETVKTMTDKIFSALDYTGFVGMDMKYRRKDGMCYILDVNPRTPASISEWVMKYNRKDLRQLFSSAEPQPLEVKKIGVRWVNLNRDFLARRDQHDWKNIWKSLSAKYDLWDSHDPLPFFMMWIFTAIRRIKKQKEDISDGN